MLTVDAVQQRVLDRLRRADGAPVPFDSLRAADVQFPAAVISELELNGVPIERVYRDGRLIGVRLAHPDDEPVCPAPARRNWLLQRWSRTDR